MTFKPFLNGLKSDLVIAEDELFMAVVEEKPLAQGHCVVFPKRAVDSWTDLNPQELESVLGFSKKIADAIEEHFPCIKVGLAILGLQVRHAHVHLVPLQAADDLNFTRPRIEITEEQLSVVAKKLSHTFLNQNHLKSSS